MMENLTTNILELSLGQKFTGEYKSVDPERGYVLADKKGENFAFKNHPHLSKAFSKATIGTVVLIEAIQNGFEVWALDEGEVKAWREEV